MKIWDKEERRKNPKLPYTVTSQWWKLTPTGRLLLVALCVYVFIRLLMKITGA
jgi:hypothetical protein